MAGRPVAARGIPITQPLLSRLSRYWSDPLYRNAIYLATTTASVAFLSFVFWALAARRVDTESIGVASSALSAVVLVSLVSRLGFDVAMMRALPAAEDAERGNIVGTAVTATLAVSLVAALAFTQATRLAFDELSWIGQDARWALGFVAATVLVTLGYMQDSLFTAVRRSDLVFHKNIGQAGGRIVLLAAAWLVASPAVLVVVAVAPLAVAALLFTPVIPRLVRGFRYRPRVDVSWLRGNAPVAASNYALTFISTAPVSLGSLLLLRRSGGEAAGEFYLYWMVGSLALVFPAALAQTTIVEAIYRRTHGLALQLAPLLVTLAGIAATYAGGFLVLPVLGLDAPGTMLAFLPFVLAALPGYYFHGRLADHRAAGTLAVVAAPLLALALFTLGLALLPPTPTWSGWAWVAALTGGAVAARLWRLPPS